MTIIANLDAAIEQHYAEVGATVKELQIFGKVWLLEPSLTTAQLDPLMKVQAAAEIANDKSRAGSQQEQMAAISMLSALPEIIAMVVVEEQREEFRGRIRSKGIPLAVAPAILEAIFVAYDAAPFTSEETSSPAPQHPTNTPLLESTSDSGSLPVSAGPSLSQPSSPSPIATAPQAAPIPAGVPGVLSAVPSPETASQDYLSQIPDTVQ